MIVDTHCHLHMDYYDKDRGEVISRIEEEGSPFILTVGISVEDSERAVSLAERFPFIYATCGVHPHDAKDFSDEALKRLEELAKSEKVVAIGEIGLDFYRNFSPKEAQFEAFEAQLELAVRLNLPVVIHTRDAHPDTKSVLRRYSSSLRGVVIHCFSGDLSDAKDYLDMGCYISFAGHTTYSKNQHLRDVAKWVPEDRLLVETDAPFLTPMPLRGKRNEPVYVRYTASVIAGVRGISTEELFNLVFENSKSLFALDNR